MKDGDEPFRAALNYAPMTEDDIAEIEAYAEIIGYHLAACISGNNQPDMSGDPRKRIIGGRRRQFDNACMAAAAAILSVSRPERA